jgi:hypothetical protein
VYLSHFSCQIAEILEEFNGKTRSGALQLSSRLRAGELPGNGRFLRPPARLCIRGRIATGGLALRRAALNLDAASGMD